jgi:hypothetical protein
MQKELGALSLKMRKVLSKEFELKRKPTKS